MPKGGRRPGAGRPKGRKNNATLSRMAELQRARDRGELPLDFMLREMRNEERGVEWRGEMAKSAAPYVHARLSAIEHAGPQGQAIPFVVETPGKLNGGEEWATRAKSK